MVDGWVGAAKKYNQFVLRSVKNDFSACQLYTTWKYGDILVHEDLI